MLYVISFPHKNRKNPYEDYVELNLEETLEHNDEPEYALFERFFHRDSFISDAVNEGSNGDNEDKSKSQSVPVCPLDHDFKASVKRLEVSLTSRPLLQIDEILQYVCNGFIADTPKRGDEYTEDERREIFESSVKLLLPLPFSLLCRGSESPPFRCWQIRNIPAKIFNSWPVLTGARFQMG